MATMQAIYLTKSSPSDPPTLKVTSVPKPEVKPGFVLVQIKASAIQPSDRLNAKGGFGKTSFPRIPGRDFAGVIVDGPKSRIGEEVFGTGGSQLGFAIDGAHAEFCLMPEALAIPKPKSLSFVQAAQIGVPFATAGLCLRHTRAKQNETVLVLGVDGAVGSSAKQIALALGCKVLGGSRRGTAEVNTKDDPSLDAVTKLTDGRGVDVVVDAVGSLDLMAAAIDKLAIRGRYGFIAAPRGGASTVMPLDVLAAYRKQMELIGCDSAGQSAEENLPEMNKLAEWFGKGDLQAKSESDLEVTTLEKIEGSYFEPTKKPVVIVFGS